MCITGNDDQKRSDMRKLFTTYYSANCLNTGIVYILMYFFKCIFNSLIDQQVHSIGYKQEC